MGSHSSATLTALSRTPARLLSGRKRTASLISKHWSSSRFAKTAMVLISRREFEHAIPYRSALLPPLDAQRHLASPDREPLRAQLRRHGRAPERDYPGTRDSGPGHDARRRDQPSQAGPGRGTQFDAAARALLCEPRRRRQSRPGGNGKSDRPGLRIDRAVAP